jgi:hypothetical protein
MPRGVYDRSKKTLQSKRHYKKRVVPVAGIDAVVRFVVIDNQEVLIWNDRFFQEVALTLKKVGWGQDDEVETERPNKPFKSPKSDHPWKRRCSKCQKTSHRSDHCPTSTPRVDEDDADEPIEKHEVTREQVQELHDEGLDALRIAARLHITLAQVKEYLA